MREYLPAVLNALREQGVDISNRLFHISDEPSAEHLDGYLAAKKIVKPYLEGYKIIDALSDAAFYDSGAVEHPVPGTNHIESFLEREIPGLWTYYCIGQGRDVSNLFVGMPTARRTRVLGAQLLQVRYRGLFAVGIQFLLFAGLGLPDRSVAGHR